MRKFLLPIIVVIAAVLYSSIVVVTEGTRGIMLRFNKVQRDAENKVVVYEPGLHFKLPLIDSIKVLDARIRTLDGSATRFVTVEKKDLLVDSYVKWKPFQMKIEVWYNRRKYKCLFGGEFLSLLWG